LSQREQESSEMERIVLIGPGAIGGAVAGALIESGRTVTLVARTPFDRLEVVHPGGQVVAPVECASSPDELSHAEFVLLGVKAHQTESASAWLEATVGPKSILVVLQNGVEHVERLRPYVPERASIVPAVVAMPARKTAPGRIEVSAPGSLTVPNDPASRRFAELIDDSFVRVRPVDDWATPAWKKLLMNAAAGGVGTLLRRDNRIFGEDDEARALVRALMLEVAAVARAEGADVPDADVDGILDVLVRRAGKHKSSIVVDRVEGRPTEWDARNAVVGRIAERHGIDVPLNRIVTTLIRLGEPAEETG
jgi:2-dehydropantoate 2-reductase